jgi:hypothetical protein
MQDSKFKMQTTKRALRLSRLLFAFCILYFALVSGACAKAKAASAPDGPPLAMPQPPPRVLAPVDEPLAATPTNPEPPATTAPRTPARPAPRRPATAGTATPEPEPRQEPATPTPPPAAAQQPTPTPTEPPRELRPAVSAADAAEERKVRDVLQRAARDLSRVDYRKLTPEGRSQYEQSKRFTDQAEQAIKDRNYVFATTLADKAAALAAELLGR